MPLGNKDPPRGNMNFPTHRVKGTLEGVLLFLYPVQDSLLLQVPLEFLTLRGQQFPR